MRTSPLLAGVLTLLVHGCAHTVGAREVASRATVELECGAAHTYVHTIARNHYAAAACGKRTIYICTGGACRRDAELSAVGSDAGIVADGRNAHERLNAVREAVLGCFRDDERHPLVIHAEFAVGGELSALDHDVTRRAAKRCIESALEEMPPPSTPYEHPVYVEHTFSSTPWEDLPDPSPPAAELADETPSPSGETPDLGAGGPPSALGEPGDVCGGDNVTPSEAQPCRDGLTCCPGGGAQDTPHVCMDLGPNGACPPDP